MLVARAYNNARRGRTREDMRRYDNPYCSHRFELAGILALIFGLVLWTGMALNIISLHMLLGLLAVAALWVIGIGQALVKRRQLDHRRLRRYRRRLDRLARHDSGVIAGRRLSLDHPGDHLLLGVLTIGLGPHGRRPLSESRRAIAPGLLLSDKRDKNFQPCIHSIACNANTVADRASYAAIAILAQRLRLFSCLR